MADVSAFNGAERPRVNWGKWTLIAIGALFSVLLLVVPMMSIFAEAFSKGFGAMWSNLLDPDMLHAIWLTVLIALITVPFNLVFGTLLAWLVTRFTFPGRQLLLTLIDIPFAVSPVVAGLIYLLFYGSNGLLGGWLDAHNIQIMFSAGHGAGDHFRHLPLRGARAGADDAQPGSQKTRPPFCWGRPAGKCSAA